MVMVYTAAIYKLRSATRPASHTDSENTSGRDGTFTLGVSVFLPSRARPRRVLGPDGPWFARSALPVGCPPPGRATGPPPGSRPAAPADGAVRPRPPDGSARPPGCCSHCRPLSGRCPPPAARAGPSVGWTPVSVPHLRHGGTVAAHGPRLAVGPSVPTVAPGPPSGRPQHERRVSRTVLRDSTAVGAPGDHIRVTLPPALAPPPGPGLPGRRPARDVAPCGGPTP
jgi:hypothetical protein